MAVIEVTSESYFTDLTTKVAPSTLIVLYFHTPWAEPCKQMNSVFNSLSAVHASASFLSINADELPEISESFDVSAVPYFVLLKDGTILRELSGADPKELAKAIQALLTSSTATNAEEKPSSTIPTQSSAAAAASGPPEEESEEELTNRLKKLVVAAPVMLFMKGTPAAPGCGFSRQMVEILREHQVRFGFFDILKDNSVREGLKTFSDWPTFPQLYIYGELHGGLDIVREAVKEDPKFFENAIAAEEN